jgi:hypothetical protein
MRRVSLKRQQLMREVAPWREAFRQRVGRCEYCLKPRMPDALAVHEISRGSHRRKALASEFAVLAVCLEPWGDPPCHDTVQGWPEVKQLANTTATTLTDSYVVSMTGRCIRQMDRSVSDSPMALPQPPPSFKGARNRDRNSKGLPPIPRLRRWP